MLTHSDKLVTARLRKGGDLGQRVLAIVGEVGVNVQNAAASHTYDLALHDVVDGLRPTPVRLHLCREQ